MIPKLNKIQSYELLFNQSPILIAHVGKDCCYKIANKRYCEWMGISQESIVGKHIKNVLTEIAFKKTKPNIDLVLAGKQVNFEAHVPHSSGEFKWVDVTYIADKDKDGNVTGFFAFIVDIDKKKQNENKYSNLLNAIDKGMEGFGLHDKNGNFIYLNSTLAQMYGHEAEELLGKSWKTLYGDDEINDIEQIHFPYLFKTSYWHGELKGKKKSGDHFDVEVSLTINMNESGEVDTLFCACRDISERKRSRQEVDFLAYHDSLTKLPNRVSFKKKLEQRIKSAQEEHQHFAVLFIDLDFFKHINDSLGHSFGDKLLQSVSERIQSAFREEDLVARLSGDEFTVLLNDISDKQSVQIAIEKLLEAFRDPFFIHSQEFLQTISIGVSLYPIDGGDVETLMKHADVAMYNVKDKGRGNYCFYTPELSSTAEENLLYRSKLQKADDNDEFILHYQPLISFNEEKIFGFEALLRWQHPELGLIFPEKFIKYIEESNLIISIGYQIIEKVCDQILQWKSNDVNFERISINVSGKQLQSGFAQTVSDILSKKNVSPDCIELEITENFLLRGLDQPIKQLNMLRELGITMSIDDFGVGYSSLSQLKQLPFHSLKIDRSFVQDIINNNDDLAIADAIIALGKTLKLDIIAEGVETIEHHKLIKKLGCQKAQGDYYSKPLIAEKVSSIYDSISNKIAS